MSRSGGSSGKSGGSDLSRLAERWDHQAHDLERAAKAPEFTAIEKRLQEMHARTKRACAQELRLEIAQQARGG